MWRSIPLEFISGSVKSERTEEMIEYLQTEWESKEKTKYD